MSYKTLSVARNVKIYLPVGTRVEIVGEVVYRPTCYTADGEAFKPRFADIVEHLGSSPYCGVALKFDEYPNVVDYTNRETANMRRL